MIDNYGTVLKEGIRSTINNHPDRDMAEQIDGAIKKYIIILKTKMNYMEANNTFCKCFSRTDDKTKKEIRKSFKSYPDAVLSLFDYMYTFSLNEISRTRTESLDNDYINSALRYSNKYVGILNKYNGSNLLQIRNRLYLSSDDLVALSYDLKPLLNYYVKNALRKEKTTVKISEVTDTGKNVFNNIEDLSNYKLRDSFHGIYKSGNVTINAASTLGYKSKRRPQQDAVLTTSKDGISLNAIADGAGGSRYGQVASIITIQELKKWFDSHDFSVFKNISPDNKEEIEKASATISNSLNDLFKRIDEIIIDKCEGSYSTVVISLVTPGFILFANIGDSTAYVYDDDNKQMIEKTTLDSMSRGLSYEEARHNPDNNMITNGVGMLSGKPHFNVMQNKGSFRIIMSSDGITDLISQDNFSLLAKNGYYAEDFVSKADRNPDVTSGMKREDNISALIIDSDEYNKKRRVR